MSCQGLHNSRFRKMQSFFGLLLIIRSGTIYWGFPWFSEFIETEIVLQPLLCRPWLLSVWLSQLSPPCPFLSSIFCPSAVLSSCCSCLPMSLSLLLSSTSHSLSPLDLCPFLCCFPSVLPLCHPLPPSGGCDQFLRCSWSFRLCFSFCFTSLSRAFLSFSAAVWTSLMRRFRALRSDELSTPRPCRSRGDKHGLTEMSDYLPMMVGLWPFILCCSAHISDAFSPLRVVFQY